MRVRGVESDFRLRPLAAAREPQTETTTTGSGPGSGPAHPNLSLSLSPLTTLLLTRCLSGCPLCLHTIVSHIRAVPSDRSSQQIPVICHTYHLPSVLLYSTRGHRTGGAS